MGRPTAEKYDSMLLQKTRWLVSHALEKAAKDLPQGRRTFHQFVEDLDVHDSFSKRIFELLVKETIQRRPRAQVRVEQANAAVPVPVNAPRQIRVPPNRRDDGSTTRARRFEARLPYVSDMAGSPPSPHWSPPWSPRSPSPALPETLPRGSETSHSSRPPPTFHFSPETLQGVPDWFATTYDSTESSVPSVHEAHPSVAMASTARSSPPREHDVHAAPVVDPSATASHTSSAPRVIPLHRPQPREEFEALSRRRRRLVRQVFRETDEHSDGDDVYERLGSSSSVAALSSLEHAHASWDAAASREQATSEELITMAQFVRQAGQRDADYRRRAELESEAEMRRFQESDTRATL